jgi:hypothetical protein
MVDPSVDDESSRDNFIAFRRPAASAICHQMSPMQQKGACPISPVRCVSISATSSSLLNMEAATIDAARVELPGRPTIRIESPPAMSVESQSGLLIGPACDAKNGAGPFSLGGDFSE